MVATSVFLQGRLTRKALLADREVEIWNHCTDAGAFESTVNLMVNSEGIMA
jgi:hypothetical protein